MAFDRLGQIDRVLVAPRFFREATAGELGHGAVPAILLQATLAHGRDQERRSAGHVTVIGCDERFWDFDPSGPHPKLGDGQIVLNEPLSEKLGAKIGDSVIVRLPMPSDIPSESALGRKTETVRSLPALKVSAIIPAEGLGRFGLRPSQQIPYLAFVATETLQRGLDQSDRVNAIFMRDVEARRVSEGSPASGDGAPAFRPKLADYGLSLVETPRGYFNLTSERMLLEEPIEQAAEKVFAPLDGQPTFTYLANDVLAGDGKGKIPYSTVTAIDFRSEPPLGPFLTPDDKTIEPLTDDEIVLNSWAADDFKKQGVTLKPGDTIRLVYFEPESLHGTGASEHTISASRRL